MKEFYISDGWYWFLIAAIVCYFIGCFNFAVLISHFKKKDIREIDISVEEGIKFVLSVGIINLDKNSDIKDLVKDDK